MFITIGTTFSSKLSYSSLSILSHQECKWLPISKNKATVTRMASAQTKLKTQQNSKVASTLDGSVHNLSEISNNTSQLETIAVILM